MPKYTIMVKQGEFIAKVSGMGNKLVIAVPKDYHDQFDKIMGKRLKFHRKRYWKNEGQHYHPKRVIIYKRDGRHAPLNGAFPSY